MYEVEHQGFDAADPQEKKERERKLPRNRRQNREREKENFGKFALLVGVPEMIW